MYDGKQVALKAYDEPNPSGHFKLFFVQDRSAEDAGRDLYHSSEPTVLVSDSFVLHFKKKTGDFINLDSPSGVIKARIVGVIVDFAAPEGVVYIDRAQYKKYWNDNLVEAFGVSAKPGFDKKTLRDEIESQFSKKYNLMTISNSEMREQILTSVDEGFSYTRAIEAAALLVALLSLFNTFLISIMERTRELGLLRAVGMSRRQMAALIIQEALVQGGFGAIVAVGLGAFIAKLWIAGSLSNVLGWIVQFSFPWTSIVTTVLLGVAVTLIAGIYPAWRAAHIEIREALEYE
jgi:putative ABC transport system permease protein